MGRPSVIVGNWKMYKTIDQTLHFIDQLMPIANKANKSEVLLAVPFTAIRMAVDRAKGSKIVIGAQNMHDATEGAYTGEISSTMLKDAGAQFVILGHSERRKLFQESNSFINRKVKQALSAKLRPILCIGESLEEREQGKTDLVLKTQLTECLAGITNVTGSQLIISYEPIWAIGTGKAATADIVQEAQKALRTLLHTLLGATPAQTIPLLYGGSVTADNAKSYLEKRDIDGLLIGSASLDPESFAKIIQLRQNLS